MRKRKENYLKKYLHYVKRENFDPIYLDESYIVQNHCRGKSWTYDNSFNFFNRPCGKGQRIILFGAISERGIVDNSFYWWNIKDKFADYHDNINGEIFLNLFKNRIIDNLEKKSLIIMDNASYHSYYKDKSYFNPKTANKTEIIDFLKSKGKIYFDSNVLKKFLVEEALKFWEKPQNDIEKIAEKNGHKILYLPPYHPEYNPIEYVWAKMKNFIADNPTYSVKEITKIQLFYAKSLINSIFCERIFRRVQNDMFDDLNYLQDPSLDYYKEMKATNIKMEYDINTETDDSDFEDDYDSDIS